MDLDRMQPVHSDPNMELFHATFRTRQQQILQLPARKFNIFNWNTKWVLTCHKQNKAEEGGEAQLVWLDW